MVFAARVFVCRCESHAKMTSAFFRKLAEEALGHKTNTHKLRAQCFKVLGKVVGPVGLIFSAHFTIEVLGD